MYVSKLQDIHSLGPLHLNLIDLGTIVHKKKKIERLLNITDESEKFDTDSLMQTSLSFRQNVQLVEMIEFGGTIPDYVANVIQDGTHNQNWNATQLSEYKTQLIYQQHNMHSALTQEDWEEDIDDELTEETVARMRVHLRGSAELPDDENDLLSSQMIDNNENEISIQTEINQIEEDNNNDNINNSLNQGSATNVKKMSRKTRMHDAMAIRKQSRDAMLLLQRKQSSQRQ